MQIQCVGYSDRDGEVMSASKVYRSAWEPSGSIPTADIAVASVVKTCSFAGGGSDALHHLEQLDAQDSMEQLNLCRASASRPFDG
jgi:hypothetical protein